MGKKPLPKLNPLAIKQAVAPLVAAVPSQKVHQGEVLPPAPQTVDEFASAISSRWRAAQDNFLRIGELLDIAQATLTADEHQTLIAQLPFGKSARSQLLTAYRAIRSGRIPEEVARAGYGTVYALASLSDQERDLAAKRGLLRADVKQGEVKAFVREMRPSAEKDREALMAERERLLARLAEIERALGFNN